jgi:rhodanese-related sulfurtransferase
MNWGRHFVEAATLIVAAILCAVVSNALASRERKLVVLTPASGERRAASSGLMPATTQSAPAAAPTPMPAPAPQPAAEVKQTPLQLPIKSAKEAGATKKPTPATPHPPPAFNPHPDKPYIEIGGDDVAALHSRGVLFLDARRTSVYEQGHIPGARPFSVWEADIDEKVNKLYAERPDPKDQNQPIVVYCSGGDCEDSHMLAQKLWGIGFNNAYVYKDGFPDWQKRGEPVHTGANP